MRLMSTLLAGLATASLLWAGAGQAADTTSPTLSLIHI